MDSFSQQFFDLAQSVTKESRLRIAPTPSGFLHLGNALNFTLNWLAAKYCGGLTSSGSTPKLYLRIDDLDSDRNRPEYVEDIFETLHWLKLDWDDDANLPAVTSPAFALGAMAGNIPHYLQILEQLRERGLLFACRKSRRDLEPFDNVYPPEFLEQGLSLDAPDVAWRIKTPPDFPLSDFIVRRRDGIPAYQVASFSDDLRYGITHIVRGADLEDSTAAQCFLAQSLSEDSFLKIKFLHHPLVLSDAGEKLSKSAGSASLKAMREAGKGPEKVFQTIGKWLDFEGDSAAELLNSMRERLL